jgi:CRISPR-associated protein Cmr5
MTNNTTINGIEQGRAKFAYECANNIQRELKESYKSHVKSFPMLIKTNGLGASLAFLFSKKDKEKEVYKKVGENIVKWLKENENYKNYGLVEPTNLEDLTKGVIRLNSIEYRALTIEVLAFFNWLKRFAEGLVKGDE